MVCKLWLEMQGEKQRCCVLKSSYEGHRCFLWKIFTQKAQIFTEGLFVQFGTNFCFMPSDLYFFQRVMCSVFVYGVVFLWYKKKNEGKIVFTHTTFFYVMVYWEYLVMPTLDLCASVCEMSVSAGKPSVEVIQKSARICLQRTVVTWPLFE